MRALRASECSGRDWLRVFQLLYFSTCLSGVHLTCSVCCAATAGDDVLYGMEWLLES